ncbi:MAG: YihY/virulence factor BrkB family protein [Candidatus Polarisedimenticolia bacterium]
MPDRGAGRAGSFFRAFWDCLWSDRVGGMAAEVAFYAVLSLFPGLLVAASALGQLERFAGRDLAERARVQVVGFMDAILTERAANVVQAVNDLFTEGSGGLFTTAVVLSIYTMSAGLMAAISAMDRIYGVAEERPWWRRRLVAICLSLGSALLLAALLALVLLGPVLGGGAELVLAAFLVLVLWATTLYQVGPAGRRSWLGSLPGGILAAALWLAGSYGLKFYVWMSYGGNSVLGAVGGGLILMMWAYILCYVLLLGAEVNRLLSRPS